MVKDAFYFPHDSNAKDDPKCVMLIEQLGLEGYGIYWILIETLRDQPEYKYPIVLIPAIARRYNTTAEKVKTVINSYGLFTIDENDFFSLSLMKRMEKVEQKREQARQAINSRWNKTKMLESDKKDDTEEIRTYNESNTNCNTDVLQVKESKVKESKVNIPYQEIYELYLDQTIVKHKNLTESMKKAIKKAVDKHSVEEVKLAIQRYGRIYNDKQNEYAVKYGKYQWTLQELMSREKGIDEFLDEGGKWIRYNEGQTKVIELKKPVESRPNAGAYKEYTGGLL